MTAAVGGVTGATGLNATEAIDGLQNAQATLGATQDSLLDVENSQDAETTAVSGEETTENTNSYSSFAKIEAKKTELETKIQQTEQLITTLEAEIEDIKAKQAKNEQDLATENAKLASYIAERDGKITQSSTIESEIRQIEAQNESEYAYERNRALLSAENEYNAEEHGNYQLYIDAKLNQLNFSPKDTTYLVTRSETLQGEVLDLNQRISHTRTTIDNLNLQKTSLANSLASKTASLQTAKANLTKYNDELVDVNEAVSVINQLSDAEKKIINDAGIDLTEKDENGNNKYFFAKGRSDGQYHLYQISETIDLSKYEVNLKKSKGSSEKATDYYAIAVVRIHSSDGGFNVIANGNGYTSNLTDNENGLDVYQMTEDGVETSQKCYSTCSPLSFDINGDGVKTSDKLINFDIDGDGVVDKINDSADWVLAFDNDGDGKAGEDGSEVFGNNTDLDGDGKADGYKDGFEALKALAKKEGMISENDSALDANELKQLSEKYGLTMKNGYLGEAKTFAELGITQINLSDEKTVMNTNFDGKGNELMTQKGATFIVNGEEKDYADIWHKKQQTTNNRK